MQRPRFASPAMRLIDLGTVPWLRSQSIHHAIASVFDETTPDTLLLVRPDRPYICVGPHQVGAALSPVAVRRGGLPVVRRRLGGGTVLITPQQTFFVMLAHRSRMPLPSPAVQRWFLGAGVEAYRRLGVDATLIGDEISSHGRKLCGSGSASIGEASVFGGNVIHDFDPAAFVDVLRLPSRRSREVLLGEVAAQMGSVRLATGRRPALEAVDRALRDGVAHACGVRLVSGSLTARERAAVAPSERWLSRAGTRSRGGPSSGCFKVRGGSGVLRARLEQPRRSTVLVVVRSQACVAVLADGRPPGPAVAELRELLVGIRVDALDTVAGRATAYRVTGGEPLVQWLARSMRLAT